MPKQNKLKLALGKNVAKKQQMAALKAKEQVSPSSCARAQTFQTDVPCSLLRL